MVKKESEKREAREDREEKDELFKYGEEVKGVAA